MLYEYSYIKANSQQEKLDLRLSEKERGMRSYVLVSKEFLFGMIRKLIEITTAQHHEYNHYQLITQKIKH